MKVADRKKVKPRIDEVTAKKIQILSRFIRGVQIQTKHYGRVEFSYQYSKDGKRFYANNLDHGSFVICNVSKIDISELEHAFYVYFGIKFST